MPIEFDLNAPVSSVKISHFANKMIVPDENSVRALLCLLSRSSCHSFYYILHVQSKLSIFSVWTRNLTNENSVFKHVQINVYVAYEKRRAITFMRSF